MRAGKDNKPKCLDEADLARQNLFSLDKQMDKLKNKQCSICLFDFVEIDFRWSWGTVHLHVLLGAVVVLLELRALDHLTKMQEALEACSSWIVSKVSSESIKI